MELSKFRFGVAFLLVACVSAAQAEILDRPGGIKIGQRMTLRPYVAFSASYDSNVNSSHDDGNGDVMWTISPTLGLTYNAENWSLLFTAFYNYHAYCKSTNSDNNRHNYGETLRWNWSNSSGVEKGWALMLGQSFRQTSAADEMTMSDGRGYTSDYRQFDITGALQRRFNENWHGDLNANYYMMDYLNDTSRAPSFYGWQRWMAGAEAGFAPSRWTDIILAGTYQGFSQDNVKNTTIDSTSQGFSVQGGIGSYMTERISYRLLAGWSRFEYGGDASSSDGFVYTASGNWKIGETWNTMLLATSYYQPSERQQASKSRVDAFSWGLAKSLVRGKLRATVDLQYRHETNEHVQNSAYDYDLDVVTGRIGLSYSLNRFLSTFVYGEYQRSWNDRCESRYGAYDYDRWRITCGFSLTY